MSTLRTKSVGGEGASLYDFLTSGLVETAFYEMNFDDEQIRGLIDTALEEDRQAYLEVLDGLGEIG